MTNLKFMLVAPALALVVGVTTSAIASEHKAEDGKKMEKHDHKDGDHKDHSKHEGKDKNAKKEDNNDHKEGDGHEHKYEKK